MIQFPGVKNDSKQVGCLFLPQQNKGMCELYYKQHTVAVLNNDV